MAKPNFQHGKRQRELAKKARQQQKLQRKAARAAERRQQPTAQDQPIDEQVTDGDSSAQTEADQHAALGQAS